MLQKSYLFVANWKMNMTFNASCEFVQNNIVQLEQLANTSQNTIILCPSFVALSSVSGLVKDANIAVGAQDCCQYARGSYTGEVDAQSLSQIGCTYCIIGHSERRIKYGETDEMIAQKVAQLDLCNIIPIVCVGETAQQYDKMQTKEVLAQQLDLVFKAAGGMRQLIIAYEPVWSVGTGMVPEVGYLETIFDWLAQLCIKLVPNVQVQLLYGGSVDEGNAQKIMSVEHINGFLIGGASLDFQKFQNIVSLNCIKK